MEKKEKIRVIFLFSLLCVFFGLVISKAFYVQVLNRDKLLTYSNNQIVRSEKVYPNRGRILDRNNKPLAINVPSYSIYAIPESNKNIKTIYRSLKVHIPSLDHEKIRKTLKKRNRFTWIARKIKLRTKAVEGLKKVKGLYVEKETKRIYPNHELMGQVLGFVGVDNHGLSGIEYFMDKKLRGNPTHIKILRDAKGRAIKFETLAKGERSEDIVLSIDKEIQERAEMYLKEAVISSESARGGIGVIDAQTGEVLALANYPSFDPNNWRNSKAEHRKLAFVSDPFEPGSAFKTFTVLSALENKVANSNTNYYCERGRLRVENHLITEYETHIGHEWLSVKDIIRHSSNIGTTKIAFDLTFPKLKKTLEKLGVGEKTGIELPAESRGIFTKKDNVRPLHLSNISFGQGVATTAIQMLTAYAPLANGGYRVTPTILKKPNLKSKRERIIDPKDLEQINDMLLQAVNSGSGTNAKMKLFEIAGKTSTAQKVKKGGGYDGYIAGFIGFPLNVKKPFVIYTYFDDPKGKSYYGGKVAAPVFKSLAEFILYKDKAYSRDKDAPQLAENNLKQDLVKIKSSSTIKRRKLISKDALPDFSGLDKKSVSKILKYNGIRAKLFGVGVVNRQSPPSGDKLSDGQVLKLYFKPPSIE